MSQKKTDPLQPISQTGSTWFLQSFWQYFWQPDFNISWKLLDFLGWHFDIFFISAQSSPRRIKGGARLDFADISSLIKIQILIADKKIIKNSNFDRRQKFDQKFKFWSTTCRKSIFYMDELWILVSRMRIKMRMTKMRGRERQDAFEFDYEDYDDNW